MKAAVKKLSAVFDFALRTAADDHAPAAARIAAIGLIGRGPHEQQAAQKALSALLAPQTPPELQAASISAIGRMHGDEALKALLGGWKGYSPDARTRVMDVALNRPEWASALVRQIEAGRVPAIDIDAIRRQRLLNSADASVRESAAKLFKEAVRPDRQKVVDAFARALKLTGDPKHGAELFAKTCTACHRFGGVGNAVGPDLASIGDKSPETLLVSVLDPNRAVEPRYVAYVVETKDGRTLTGVLGGETSTTITLMQPSVEPLQILRTDVKSLRSSGISLMPEGLETGMSPQDVADLIEHVRSVGPQPERRQFAGNNPRVVMPDNGGRLWVPAAAAEIFGSGVQFEMQYGNVGFWDKEDASVVWTVQPARAGRYLVFMDYACDNGTAGNMYLLQAGPSRLTGRIEGTGSWDDYKLVRLGELTLGAGRQRITFRSNGKLSKNLCDLQAIELVPVKEQ
jgi:putative heme-binding domain-containing protein